MIIFSVDKLLACKIKMASKPMYVKKKGPSKNCFLFSKYIFFFLFSHLLFTGIILFTYINLSDLKIIS